MVGCAEGKIGYDIRKHELGIVVGGQEAGENAMALGRVTCESAERRQWSKNCIVAAQAHTKIWFGEAVCQALEQALAIRAGK